MVKKFLCNFYLCMDGNLYMERFDLCGYQCPALRHLRRVLRR